MNMAKEYQIADSLRQYIYPVLMELQLGACADCGKENERMEIDHLRYGEVITVYDLQLLCRECHERKTSQSHERHLVGFHHCLTCTCYSTKQET